jgi:hypothetical protein
MTECQQHLLRCADWVLDILPGMLYACPEKWLVSAVLASLIWPLYMLTRVSSILDGVRVVGLCPCSARKDASLDDEGWHAK